MTHAELVEAAAKWLKNKMHCSVIATELSTCARSRETPDVIGWVGGRCILVECKTSVADFFADQRKPARHPMFPALGDWRFYLAPQGVIRSTPKGWGSYSIDDGRVFHVAGAEYSNMAAPPNKSDLHSEKSILLSMLRRTK